MTVETRVRDFITEWFYVSDPGSLSDDLSLIDSGLVDSTGMMDVIVFLETEYGFHVEDDEMVPENLESIELIARFVERKTGDGSRAIEEIASRESAAGTPWRSVMTAVCTRSGSTGGISRRCRSTNAGRC